MKNNLIFTNIDSQKNQLIEILNKNTSFTKLLRLLSANNLPNWYIGGGSIPQIIWNYHHNFDLNHGIKDFDVVYFDKKLIVKSQEIKRQKIIQNKYSDFTPNIEVVNEARTHLWYEKDFGKKIKPYSCTEEAIYCFPTTASAVGITIKKGKILVYAPHGLSDLFGLVVKANKVQISRKVFEEKSKRWKKAWPKLTVIPWEYK